MAWWSVFTCLIAVLGALPPGTISENEQNCFFCTIILFDYFRLPAGQMVMESLFEGGEGLWNTFKVAMILITIWAVGGFIMFEDEINENNDCTTVYQCWYLGVDAGFRGDMVGMHGTDHDDIYDAHALNWGDKSKGQFQWWYVIFFLAIWDFVIAGIIQGQIVDAFAEIRQAAADLKADKEDKCLVCSLERFTLEQNVGSFQDHTEESHNPWSYLFFMVFLDELRDDLETGMQNFVT